MQAHGRVGAPWNSTEFNIVKLYARGGYQTGESIARKLGRSKLEQEVYIMLINFNFIYCE